MNLEIRKFKHKTFVILTTDGENPIRADAEQAFLDMLGKATSKEIPLKAKLCTDDHFNNYIRIEL